MNSTTTPIAGNVTLVDLDGGPVPVWAQDAPIVPPFDPDEESDPATWPAWTDNWYWEPTDPAEVDQVEDSDRSIPAEAVLEPLDWIDLSPDDMAFLESIALPPLSGGAPDSPTADDIAEMMAHTRFIDMVADLRQAEDRATLAYGWE